VVPPVKKLMLLFAPAFWSLRISNEPGVPALSHPKNAGNAGRVLGVIVDCYYATFAIKARKIIVVILVIFFIYFCFI